MSSYEFTPLLLPNKPAMASVCSDDMSIWSGLTSSTAFYSRNPTTTTLATDTTRAHEVDQVEDEALKLFEMTERMIQEAKRSLNSPAGLDTSGEVLADREKLKLNTAADWVKAADLNLSSHARDPGSQCSQIFSLGDDVFFNPPKVIEMPEWLATLQLLAVQRPHLSSTLYRLEGIGRGYYVKDDEKDQLREIGKWLTTNVGPVEVQLYSSRISSLKKRIGARTRSVGEEAIEIHPYLDVKYFHSRVVSVKKCDVQELSLKILASSGNLEPHTVIDIGRGVHPSLIKQVSNFWARLEKGLSVILNV